MVGHGVLFNNTFGAVVFNNNVTARGMFSLGVYFDSGYSANVSYNRITTIGSSSDTVRFYSGSSNVVLANWVNVSSGSGAGVNIMGSNSNNVSGNNITAIGGFGMTVWAANSNTLSYNSIYATEGVRINGDSNNLSSSTILSLALYGLQFYSAYGSLVRDVTISSGGNDISVVGAGINNLTNCTFTKSDTGFDGAATGFINVFWYADVHVINNTGSDVANASVNASNVNGNSSFNATTNATGWIPQQTVQEYAQNITSVYNYTPHWVNASKTGLFSNNTATAITTNAVVTLTLINGISVDACQDLSTAGMTYVLNQSVSSAGTCFNITANNVTLDCDGYTINYSGSGVGYGVNVTGVNYSVVKNCVINQTST
ncbi:hypothetical protein COX84_03045, partial [Candidatus Micrarchaeota archaeon CG_4_10_14_0_2_um_filter_49_7]